MRKLLFVATSIVVLAVSGASFASSNGASGQDGSGGTGGPASGIAAPGSGLSN